MVNSSQKVNFWGDEAAKKRDENRLLSLLKKSDDNFSRDQTRGGGALGYFLGGYVLPGTPNWHPVLEKISHKIDTPF